MSGLILFEDDHLLVVNKPSGINTHKPDCFAPDGLHEWLTKREPRWRNLSILQRLDKDTSGVMLFGKTPQANQSLSRQFESHQVRKQYLLLAATRPTRQRFQAHSAGAVTEFEFVQPHNNLFLMLARPVTGKTHQIRRHAAENEFPVLGDTQYGGPPAPRLMLHAHRLTIRHPATDVSVTFEASVPRAFDDRTALVAAQEFRELIFSDDTTAFRLMNGAGDGMRDIVVDSFAGHLLAQWQTPIPQPELLAHLGEACHPLSIHEQFVTKQQRTAPRLVLEGRAPARPPGATLAERISILENGVTYLVGFGEGLSAGIFLDQRENRRRLLTMNLAGKTVLNCFAYTCAFSVAAALAGAVTTSVDLSKNYLEWGRENFRANKLDDTGHEFRRADVFDWLKQAGKRSRVWDIVIVDPPTFSTTKQGRAFQATRDYGELAARALPVVAPGGTLLCSTNQRTLAAADFEKTLRDAVRQGGRVIEGLEFVTLPFDFRVAPGERPYLKAFWVTLK